MALLITLQSSCPNSLTAWSRYADSPTRMSNGLGDRSKKLPFKKIIQNLVTEASVLSYYNPSSDLAIHCDASRKGLGAALLQDHKPVVYASHALTETETRYAQILIEKEMLAIVYALEKFNQFTYGRHITIYSDHKPLEAISKKPLAPRRLQGMIMRFQKCDLDVQYERGKNMYIADLLTRAYLPNTDHENILVFDTSGRMSSRTGS